MTIGALVVGTMWPLNDSADHHDYWQKEPFWFFDPYLAKAALDRVLEGCGPTKRQDDYDTVVKGLADRNKTMTLKQLLTEGRLGHTKPEAKTHTRWREDVNSLLIKTCTVRGTCTPEAPNPRLPQTPTHVSAGLRLHAPQLSDHFVHFRRRGMRMGTTTCCTSTAA